MTLRRSVWCRSQHTSDVNCALRSRGVKFRVAEFVSQPVSLSLVQGLLSEVGFAPSAASVEHVYDAVGSDENLLPAHLATSPVKILSSSMIFVFCTHRRVLVNATWTFVSLNSISDALIVPVLILTQT